MKFGAHMSTSGGVWKALERGSSIHCDVVQIFVKNNMQWFGKPYVPADLAQYANQLASHKLGCVFGHTGYLINLGAPPSANRDKSIQSLIQEINLAADLGLPFLVMHPGAHLGAGEQAGIDRAVEFGLLWKTRQGRGLACAIRFVTWRRFMKRWTSRAGSASAWTRHIFLRRDTICACLKVGMRPSENSNR
jgi:sugar phosphate isomerase/epimerase